MDAATRKRLITYLKRLSRSDFDAVVAEARSQENVEEQAVAAFAAAFAQRAAETPFSPLAGLHRTGQEEEP